MASLLRLDRKIVLNAEAIKDPNLAVRFEKDDQKRIAAWVHRGYSVDRASRATWERRMHAALDLAMQLVKEKTFPWPNASNVAFPLVTIAALQFHARAYPEIIQGTDVVRTRVFGTDDTGEVTERAQRIAKHMSWQRLEQDEQWEESADRMLIVVPILGCAFKKTYYSGEKAYGVSELVLPHDLVLAYRARSVEDCPRKTHMITLSRNTIYERAVRGTFLNVRDEAWFQKAPAVVDDRSETDKRQGVAPPEADETTPYNALEQHVNLDLDQDGYAEPYIITIEAESQSLLRIVSAANREEDVERVNRKIVCVHGQQYFTKIPFIPSPDGGIYDYGFGMLLGPLNDSVSSIVNVLIDSGTMGATGGGFIGRGAKMRGGAMTFGPFQWNRVDATGDDLRKNIVPLEIREPSAVLFQLLNFLVEYTQRIGGATDTLAGENPGQNTKTGTFEGMVEQGEKIYSGLFKRIWRGMKKEFQKCFQLNAVYLPEVERFGPGDAVVRREDYLSASIGVVPVADPHIVSSTQRLRNAAMLAERAQVVPGYNKDAVERRLLSAMRTEAPEQIFRGSEGMQPPVDPRIQVENIRDKRERDLAQQKMQLELIKLLEDRAVQQANIAKLYADAAFAMESAGGVRTGHQIAMFEAQVGAERAKDDALVARIQQLRDTLDAERGRQHEAGMHANELASAERIANMKGASGAQAD